MLAKWLCVVLLANSALLIAAELTQDSNGISHVKDVGGKASSAEPALVHRAKRSEIEVQPRETDKGGTMSSISTGWLGDLFNLITGRNSESGQNQGDMLRQILIDLELTIQANNNLKKNDTTKITRTDEANINKQRALLLKSLLELNSALDSEDTEEDSSDISRDVNVSRTNTLNFALGSLSSSEVSSEEIITSSEETLPTSTSKDPSTIDGRKILTGLISLNLSGEEEDGENSSAGEWSSRQSKIRSWQYDDVSASDEDATNNYVNSEKNTNDENLNKKYTVGTSGTGGLRSSLSFSLYRDGQSSKENVYSKTVPTQKTNNEDEKYSEDRNGRQKYGLDLQMQAGKSLDETKSENSRTSDQNKLQGLLEIGIKSEESPSNNPSSRTGNPFSPTFTSRKWSMPRNSEDEIDSEESDGSGFDLGPDDGILKALIYSLDLDYADMKDKGDVEALMTQQGALSLKHNLRVLLNLDASSGESYSNDPSSSASLFSALEQNKKKYQESDLASPKRSNKNGDINDDVNKLNERNSATLEALLKWNSNMYSDRNADSADGNPASYSYHGAFNKNPLYEDYNDEDFNDNRGRLLAMSKLLGIDLSYYSETNGLSNSAYSPRKSSEDEIGRNKDGSFNIEWARRAGSANSDSTKGAESWRIPSLSGLLTAQFDHGASENSDYRRNGEDIYSKDSRTPLSKEGVNGMGATAYAAEKQDPSTLYENLASNSPALQSLLSFGLDYNTALGRSSKSDGFSSYTGSLAGQNLYPEGNKNLNSEYLKYGNSGGLGYRERNYVPNGDTSNYDGSPRTRGQQYGDSPDSTTLSRNLGRGKDNGHGRSNVNGGDGVNYASSLNPLLNINTYNNDKDIESPNYGGQGSGSGKSINSPGANYVSSLDVLLNLKTYNENEAISSPSNGGQRSESGKSNNGRLEANYASSLQPLLNLGTYDGDKEIDSPFYSGQRSGSGRSNSNRGLGANSASSLDPLLNLETYDDDEDISSPYYSGQRSEPGKSNNGRLEANYASSLNPLLNLGTYDGDKEIDSPYYSGQRSGSGRSNSNRGLGANSASSLDPLLNLETYDDDEDISSPYYSGHRSEPGKSNNGRLEANYASSLNPLLNLGTYDGDKEIDSPYYSGQRSGSGRSNSNRGLGANFASSLDALMNFSTYNGDDKTTSADFRGQSSGRGGNGRRNGGQENIQGEDSYSSPPRSGSTPYTRNSALYASLRGVLGASDTSDSGSGLQNQDLGYPSRLSGRLSSQLYSSGNNDGNGDTLYDDVVQRGGKTNPNNGGLDFTLGFSRYKGDGESKQAGLRAEGNWKSIDNEDPSNGIHSEKNQQLDLSTESQINGDSNQRKSFEWNLNLSRQTDSNGKSRELEWNGTSLRQSDPKSRNKSHILNSDTSVDNGSSSEEIESPADEWTINARANLTSFGNSILDRVHNGLGTIQNLRSNVAELAGNALKSGIKIASGGVKTLANTGQKGLQLGQNMAEWMQTTAERGRQAVQSAVDTVTGIAKKGAELGSRAMSNLGETASSGLQTISKLADTGAQGLEGLIDNAVASVKNSDVPFAQVIDTGRKLTQNLVAEANIKLNNEGLVDFKVNVGGNKSDD